MTAPPTLGAVFDTRRNALNALRLVLALLVVVWHSWWLTEPFGALAWPAKQLLEELPVDAFFAISGLLITRAWLRRPEARTFLTARALRLLPGLWMCLAFTAFVLAPMAGGVVHLDAQLGYVWANAGVVPTRDTVDGSEVAAWNVSLWTLGWEAACYLAVCALGVAGALRTRVVLGVALFFWTIALIVAPFGELPGRSWFDALPRLGLMFACGSLLWLARDRVQLRGRLAGLAVAAVALGSVLPDYRLVAAPAVAYLAVWIGVTLGRWSALVLENDISYGVYVYGFPVQQTLLATGVTGAWLSLTALTTAVVVPLAAASWWFVERPAMRLRGRFSPGPRHSSRTATPPGRAGHGAGCGPAQGSAARADADLAR